VQIFVSGTWRPDKAAQYAEEAELLGRLIASSGFDLACGPGTGIARHVIDGYREVGERGVVRYYLPQRAHMEAVGEAIEPGYDELIETDYDYPMRNVWQIRQSDGLFVLTGGDGTLEEILPALIDYHLPVALVRGSGSAASAVERLLDLYPDWRELVAFGDSVSELADTFFENVKINVPVRP
jgi:predicted Rossmann-fold nucleotide-binding protein